MNEQTMKTLMINQKALDETIYRAHNIDEKKIGRGVLLRKKVQSYRAELGELENEVEDFKYWKINKGKPNQLEEFVDGVFFLLSIGVLQGYRPLDIYPYALKDIGTQFDETYLYTSMYIMDTSYTKWLYLFRMHLGLAEHLEFTTEDILKAYDKKYEENLKRVKVGY